MKGITLLFAVAGLSSCVPKPWLVGSVNDQLKPPRLGASYKTEAEKAKAAQGGDMINPVGHVSSNPTK